MNSQNPMPIILHSKYSKISSDMFNTVANLKIQNVATICIDNNENKTAIIMNSPYDINILPCILLASPHKKKR